MTELVKKAVSDKPVKEDLADIVTVLNRELIPTVKEIRSVLNTVTLAANAGLVTPPIDPTEDNRVAYALSGDLAYSQSVLIAGTGLSVVGSIAAASVAVSGVLSGASLSVTGGVTGASVTATGLVSGGSVTAAGAVTGGSLSTLGALSAASGNITGLLSAGSISAGTLTAASIGLGTDPASAGLLRLGNAQGGIQFDDGSPGSPLRALEADSSSLWVGEAGFNDTQYFADTQHLFVAGAATQLSIVDGTIDAQDCEIKTTGNISVGAAPATGTGIRLDYGVGLGLHGKDSLGVSHSMLEFGASGELQLGSTTIDQLNIAWESGQSAFFYTGNGDILRLADGLIEPTADLRWHADWNIPAVYQDDNFTSGATGFDFVVQAQGAPNGASTGGRLRLLSGFGVSAHGVVEIGLGAGAETSATFSSGLANFQSSAIRTNGNLDVGYAVTTGTILARLGAARTDNGQAELSLFSSSGGTVATTFRRYSTANGIGEIRHQGTGAFQFVNHDAADFLWYTSNVEKWRLTAAGVLRPAAALSGTLDLGALAARVAVGYFNTISTGASPATGTSGVKLSYGDGIFGKDAAGTGHSMLQHTAGNELQLGDTSTLQLNVAWQSGQSAYFYTGNGDILRLADGVIEPLADIIFHKDYDNPVIYHDSDGTNATGDQFVIEAQSGSTTGGNLLLHSGSGGTTHGSIVLAVGSGAETIATLSAGLANFDNNEIRTTGFLALGTTVAASGQIRLPSNFAIRGINGANTISVLEEDGAGNLYLGGTNGGNLNFRVGAGTEMTISSTLINCQDNEIRTTGFLAVGTNPATGGAVRLANNTSLQWRDAANSFNISALSVNTFNTTVLFGQGGIFYNCAVGAIHSFNVNAVSQLALSATLADFGDNEIRTTGFLTLGTSPASSGVIRGPTAMTYNVPTGGSHSFQVNGSLGTVAAAAYAFSATVGIGSGAGDPNGAVTAGVGSLFVRNDGAAQNVISGKFSGTGNTGWLPLAPWTQEIELFINAGDNSITIPSTAVSPILLITLDTSGPSTQNITTINGGIRGQVLIFNSATGSRDPTFVNTATPTSTKFVLAASTNFTLTAAHDQIMFRGIDGGGGGIIWTELSRSDNR